MKSLPLPTAYLLGGLALLGAAFWLTRPGNAAGVGAAVGGAAVEAATGAVAGVATGIGDVVGLPRTNQSQCRLDLLAGNTWDASFSCGAGDYLKYLTTGEIPPN